MINRGSMATILHQGRRPYLILDLHSWQIPSHFSYPATPTHQTLSLPSLVNYGMLHLPWSFALLPFLSSLTAPLESTKPVCPILVFSITLSTTTAEILVSVTFLSPPDLPVLARKMPGRSFSLLPWVGLHPPTSILLGCLPRLRLRSSRKIHRFPRPNPHLFPHRS